MVRHCDPAGRVSAARAGGAGLRAWGGSISFTTAEQFDFGSGVQSPPGEISFNPPQNFAAVAWHELGHVLGIGLALTWQRYVSPGGFTGPNAEAVYGGPVPLQPGGSHWAAGLVFGGTLDLMDGGGDSVTATKSGMVSLNTVFSRLDYAALEDIGWVVQPPAMAVVPRATGIVSVKHARQGVTAITIAFNEALNPASADNLRLYSAFRRRKAAQEDGLQQVSRDQKRQLQRQRSRRDDQACQASKRHAAFDRRNRHPAPPTAPRAPAHSRRSSSNIDHLSQAGLIDDLDFAWSRLRARRRAFGAGSNP